MPGSGIFVNASGGKSLTEVLGKYRKLVAVTTADALYAGQRQRTRMLERTARHIDADGAAFAPYSTERLYYDPNHKLSKHARSKISDKQQKATVNRLFRKVNAAGHKVKHMGGAPYVSRSGQTICFPGGYAQLKAWAGRTGVDLRSLLGPHMLQAILIKIAKAIGNAANEMRIGIYDDFGARAAIHNAGKGKMPRRHFFGIGRGDLKLMAADVLARIKARLS